MFPRLWRRFWASLRTLCTPAPLRPAPRCLLLLESLEGRLTPSAVNWSGAGDGTSWSDPANWAGGMVPTASDDVTIASGSLVLVNTTAAVNSLQCSSPLQVLISLWSPTAASAATAT